MKLTDLKKEARVYAPAIALDIKAPFIVRQKIFAAVRFFTSVFLLLTLLHFFLSKSTLTEGLLETIKVRLMEAAPIIYGLLFVTVSFWLFFAMLAAFYNSYYFRGTKTNIAEPFFSEKKKPLLTFELAGVVYRLNQSDITASLLKTPLFQLVMVRLGISLSSVDDFISQKREPVLIDDIEIPPPRENETLTVNALSGIVFDKDKAFAAFLAGFGVSGEDFKEAGIWVARAVRKTMNGKRLWGRDALGSIPSIGKNWSYGETYNLDLHATDITNRASMRTIAGPASLLENELEELQTVLSRSKEANALVIGNQGGLREEILFRLASDIESGKVLPQIEHKRLYVFDGVSFILRSKDKAHFEAELAKLLDEAARAGNIILSFVDLYEFLKNAKLLGSEALDIMEPYLASPLIQFIGFADERPYHEELSRDEKLVRFFEKIELKPISKPLSLSIIEDEALRLEASEGVLVLYGAVAAAYESADRYMTDGAMPDKALHLLEEAAVLQKAARQTVLTREAVLSLVREKTGIPAGAPDYEEREKLLGLEDKLRERLVGQNEAVVSVASGLRRARSGITNQNRPMGSFLFLGPTGVGKTETAKSLAGIFFGSEEEMVRIDMTEYQSANSLDRLIGSFESENAGILALRLREKPYGVLLLDEFEKCHTTVKDLFLQVLDEGFFSDVSGKRVGAQNLIIIATSNAGSEKIWEMTEKGETTIDKSVILNEIISSGMFRPELLNRFDSVVVFNPLGQKEMRMVAELQIKKLRGRLKERKGIELVIDDGLLDSLVVAASDRRFGARAMNRLIQDKIERVVADKILRGAVKAGEKLKLSATEVN
ncbi:MAG: AAA family ATPase [bacterium]|nr:AAA family ATPase [bacterium]